MKKWKPNPLVKLCAKHFGIGGLEAAGRLSRWRSCFGFAFDNEKSLLSFLEKYYPKNNATQKETN